MNLQILVCTTCASQWSDGQRVGISGGETLYQSLKEALPLCSVQPVACMSACSHACVVAFSQTQKHTYVFGKLPHDPEDLPTALESLITCANSYLDAPDGLVGWSERPPMLKNAVIARIPPLPIAP